MTGEQPKAHALRIDFSQPFDEQFEWHTEASTGQCHAYLAAVLAEDRLTYTALCGCSAAKTFITAKCVEPFCAGCQRIIAAALVQAGTPIEDTRPGGRME